MLFMRGPVHSIYNYIREKPCRVTQRNPYILGEASVACLEVTLIDSHDKMSQKVMYIKWFVTRMIWGILALGLLSSH